jgi:hypothetical protein
MESTTAAIYDKSSFMRTRGKTMQREINEIRNKVSGRSSMIEGSYFYLIHKMQMVVDVPTWLGAYHKAIEQGHDEETAVALADQSVIDAQGGGQIKDLAEIQRGGPMMKLWTNFYSYFSTTYNLLVESTGRAKDPAGKALLAVDYLLLLVVPAVLGATMKAALKGGDDWEEELPEKLVREQANYLLGTMVGLRDVAAFVNGYGNYTGPAGLRFFSEIFRLGKQVEQGEADEAFWKALNSTAGILFHYPSGQVQRTAEGIAALAEGETVNPGVILVGTPAER